MKSMKSNGNLTCWWLVNCRALRNTPTWCCKVFGFLNFTPSILYILYLSYSFSTPLASQTWLVLSMLHGYSIASFPWQMLQSVSPVTWLSFYHTLAISLDFPPSPASALMVSFIPWPTLVIEQKGQESSCSTVAKLVIGYEILMGS